MMIKIKKLFFYKDILVERYFFYLLCIFEVRH